MSQPIEFFFDIGSPYSYLAATQIDEVAARAGTEAIWKPFLLGAVFKAVGNTMPAKVKPKGAWMFQDLGQWADHYGVPFQMSSHFPINSLLAQRALVAARHVDADRVSAFALTLFRDYWAEDVDVSEADAVVDAAGRSGFDGANVVELASDQAIKDELRALTEEAVERGAFGAPTFFVGEQMLWGNDRLHFVEAAARS